MKNLFLILVALISVASLNSCATADGENAAESKVEETKKEELISADVVNNPNSAESTTTSNGNLPVMTFEKDLHDFGEVFEGEKVEYNFKFTNTGESPLVISSAKGSCGCTVPSYPEEPVASGESAFMKVTFDSKGRPGKFTKEVSITANTAPNVNRLVITGNVTSPAE